MGGCYNLELLYMQALDDLDLTFSVIYCNILVMNLGELENIIIIIYILIPIITMLHSLLFIIRN